MQPLFSFERDMESWENSHANSRFPNLSSTLIHVWPELLSSKNLVGSLLTVQFLHHPSERERQWMSSLT
jgi:hypothetical protein